METNEALKVWSVTLNLMFQLKQLQCKKEENIVRMKQDKPHRKRR